MTVAVVSDSWIIGFGILSLIWSTVMSLALFRLGSAARATETIESRLHTATAALVDTRLLQITATVEQHVKTVTSMVGELKERIREAEDEVGNLGDRDQRIELAVANKFDALKDFLRETVAGKKDLERHEEKVALRHELVDERMGNVERQVAVLADRLSK